MPSYQPPLVCPACRVDLPWAADALRCPGCGACYPVEHGIPLLFAGEPEEHTNELYDEIAHLYDGAMPAHIAAHYRRKRVAFVRRYLPAGGTLLDVGCGTGSLAAALHEAGYRVAGTDASLGMLRIFRQRFDTGLVAGRSDDLPFPDGAFDGVICVALLHHVADPKRVAGTIREMVRVTRPGGHTVLWDHNPLNPYWYAYMKRIPQDSGDERLVPLRELLAPLDDLPCEAYRLGFTPDFVPRPLMGLMRALESALERVPGVRAFAAHNVVVVRKPEPDRAATRGVGR